MIHHTSPSGSCHTAHHGGCKDELETCSWPISEEIYPESSNCEWCSWFDLQMQLENEMDYFA